jgi:hypothetical protein
MECENAVEEDAKKLRGVRNWKRAAQERERGMEGLDKGDRAPISGCCTIEEDGLLYISINLLVTEPEYPALVISKLWSWLRS